MSEIPLAGGDVNIGENAVVRVDDRMHDAQEGLALPDGVAWPDLPVEVTPDSVVCHNDLFWPNVIFRDGRPVALIDWGLAAPAPRLFDLASAASYWVPLRPDDQAEEWGLPTRRRGSRLRLLCDAYGLDRDARLALPDIVTRLNELGYEAHRTLGGVERRPGWREMWDAGSGDQIRARIAWFETQRDELLAFLR